MLKGKIKNDFLCHIELYCHIRLQKKKKKKEKGSRVIFSVCLVLDSKVSFFLLFSFFLVLFMGLIVLFGTIHESHYTISDTF